MYVDFSKLVPIKGDFKKEVKPFQPSEADMQQLKNEGYDPTCQTALRLCWGYNYLNDSSPGRNFLLQLTGVKIGKDGAIDDIVSVQPLVSMRECGALVVLPKSGCCKTYWYAYFVDPNSGYFSSSSYVGADTIISELSLYDGTCCCEECVQDPAAVEVKVPSDLPIFCCGKETENRSDITFLGGTNLDATAGFMTPTILVPLEELEGEVTDGGENEGALEEEVK